MYIVAERRKQRWTIASARQYLPRLISLAAREPQAVYRRDKLVAGVVSPELKQKIDEGGVGDRRASLAAELQELRRLCAEDDYQLSTPKRVDRRPGRAKR